MFGNLFKEAEAVASRSSNIQARIDRLAIRVTQLDSTVEEGMCTVHSEPLMKKKNAFIDNNSFFFFFSFITRYSTP